MYRKPIAIAFSHVTIQSVAHFYNIIINKYDLIMSFMAGSRISE